MFELKNVNIMFYAKKSGCYVSKVHNHAMCLKYHVQSSNPSCSIKYCIIDIHGWSCWRISHNNANQCAIKCISKFNIIAPPNCLQVAKWSCENCVTPIFSSLCHNMNIIGCNNVCNSFVVPRDNDEKHSMDMGIMIHCTTWVAYEMTLIDTSNT